MAMSSTYSNAAGFMSSPISGNKTNFKSNTILCCNIKELIEAKQEEDYFVLQNGKMLDTNVSFNQIIIVGQIIGSNEGPSRFEYQIDDRSGHQIEVQHYLNSDDDHDENIEKASSSNKTNQIDKLIECGTFVSIVGHLRVFGKSRSIVAFNVRPLKSYNELTTHLLRVLYNYLLIKKADFQQLNNQQTIINNLSNNVTSTFDNTHFSGIDSGFTDNQKQVLNCIRRLQGQNGCHINSLKKDLRNLNVKHIQDALEFLSNEGHIYSTIDDDHFMTTD